MYVIKDDFKSLKEAAEYSYFKQKEEDILALSPEVDELTEAANDEDTRVAVVLNCAGFVEI